MNTLKSTLGLGLMVLSLLVLEGRLWPQESAGLPLLVLLASGGIGLTIGDTCYFHALSRIGPRRTLLMAALTPPTTALLAVPVLGERLSWRSMLGGAGVGGGGGAVVSVGAGQFGSMISVSSIRSRLPLPPRGDEERG